jgi:hypothetical protein
MGCIHFHNLSPGIRGIRRFKGLTNEKGAPMRLMLITSIVGLAVVASGIAAMPRGNAGSVRNGAGVDMPHRSADMQLPVRVRAGQRFVLGSRSDAGAERAFAASVRNTGASAVVVSRRVAGSEGPHDEPMATILPGGMMGGTIDQGETLTVSSVDRRDVKVEVLTWGETKLPMGVEMMGE